MSNDKVSALISLAVAVIVLAASHFQWYVILYDGYKAKAWVDIFLITCVVLLLVSAYFLIKKS